MLNNQSIFITGGTGTVGKAFLKKVLADYPNVKSITIYSRDEMKQYELRQQYPSNHFRQIKWVIGDIRDSERLTTKMKGVDIVIHAAAMKHIPICEENPEECLKTNVGGTKNVIRAALDNRVGTSVLCSTDKAVDPISVYGNSKQAAEKLFLNAEHPQGKFSIVRLGNIWGSRGSVVTLFTKLAKTGIIPITHPDMTRFFCTQEQVANSLIYALQNIQGREIIIPKMEAKKIVDIANEIAPGCEHKIIGLRGFEKISERLASTIDLKYIWENHNYWIINSSKTNSDFLNSIHQAKPILDIKRLDSQVASDALFKYQLN